MLREIVQKHVSDLAPCPESPARRTDVLVAAFSSCKDGSSPERTNLWEEPAAFSYARGPLCRQTEPVATPPQATLGPCDAQKPWSWNVIENAKWNSWKQLNNMPARPRSALRCFVIDVASVPARAAGWLL